MMYTILPNAAVMLTNPIRSIRPYPLPDFSLPQTAAIRTIQLLYFPCFRARHFSPTLKSMILHSLEAHPSLLPITSTCSQCPLAHPTASAPASSRLNSDPHSFRLCNNTLTQSLQTQPTQPQLALLNLRNLINMLETNCPHSPIIIAPSLQLPLVHLHTRCIE
jgi:hypothetical protein